MVFAELAGGAHSVVRLESAAIMTVSRRAPAHVSRPHVGWLLLPWLTVAGCGQPPAETDAVPSTAATQPAAERAPSQLGLCAACHGRDGIAVAENTPDLAGRERSELLAAMEEYLDGRRDHAPMRAMLGPIRPVDREALADWFAAQPAASAAPP